MTNEQETIGMLYKALSQIATEGTHYPPFWDKYTDQQKVDFPPHMTKAAKIALAAMSNAQIGVAP